MRVSHEFCIIEIAVAIVWNDEKSTGISGIGAILGVKAGAFLPVPLVCAVAESPIPCLSILHEPTLLFKCASHRAL